MWSGLLGPITVTVFSLMKDKKGSEESKCIIILEIKICSYDNAICTVGLCFTVMALFLEVG